MMFCAVKDPTASRITILVAIALGYALYHLIRWYLVRQAGLAEREPQDEGGRLEVEQRNGNLSTVQPPTSNLQPSPTPSTTPQPQPSTSTSSSPDDTLFSPEEIREFERMGRMAWSSGWIVEAHYWTALAEANGVRGLTARLSKLERDWVRMGCPDEAENIHPGYNATKAALATAYMLFKTGMAPRENAAYIVKQARMRRRTALSLALHEKLLRHGLVIACVVFALAVLADSPTRERLAKSAKKPNIIFVLADDLGYGDVGWTVQNARKKAGQIYISTPNMDQMVREGCEFTSHYAAAPVCAPSRASILTGKHQGCCSLRDNHFDCPILEERTIASVLREQGYATFAVGKWGVGGGGESGQPRTAHPLDRGFDHYYGYLDHLAGHTYYHHEGVLKGAYMGIYEDREKRTDTATGLYSTDLLVARAKKVLVDHFSGGRLKVGGGTKEVQPLFLYLAVNAAHGSGADKLDDSVPHKANIHVPGRAYPDANPATEKKYGVGEGADWDWLQANREPIEARNTWLYDYTKGYDEVGGGVKARYATTITRLDEAMADLKQTLIDLGIADNTIVIFTSDNGPTNEYGTNVKYFDSNGPFQGMKRSCMEGGLRVPTFIWAPGYVKAGSRDERPSMSHSWFAYCLAAAKGFAAQPIHAAGGAAARKGLRALPLLSDEVYTEYSFGGASQIMARIGDYVGVNTKVTAKSLDQVNLAVYDVVKDPGQTKDLAATPAGQKLLPKFRAQMKKQHTPSKENVRSYDAK